jgi:hypothetical protein
MPTEPVAFAASAVTADVLCALGLGASYGLSSAATPQS